MLEIKNGRSVLFQSCQDTLSDEERDIRIMGTRVPSSIVLQRKLSVLAGKLVCKRASFPGFYDSPPTYGLSAPISSSGLAQASPPSSSSGFHDNSLTYQPSSTSDEFYSARFRDDVRLLVSDPEVLKEATHPPLEDSICAHKEQAMCSFRWSSNECNES